MTPTFTTWICAPAAITAILVIGGIAGSVIVAKTSATHKTIDLPAASPGGGTATTVANPKTGSGNSQSIIDAVTLLLHFQSISTSGLLSISYPTIYRFFTYTFAWANLIVTSEWLKDAVRHIGINPSCLRAIGSLNPALTADSSSDIYPITGMSALGTRHDLDRATIGGLVYITAIIGVAVSLAIFFLISVLLHILNGLYNRKFQAYIDIWPSRASSMTLRLVSSRHPRIIQAHLFYIPKFIWVLGSIATFAIYQFADPCSSVSLITFASIEFALIVLTLLIVSIFIVKTAKAQGSEALYRLSESEESVYSRRWGSLYGLLKPALYWFFIPDYVWVLVKSIIVGAGQVNKFKKHINPFNYSRNNGFLHHRVLDLVKYALWLVWNWPFFSVSTQPFQYTNTKMIRQCPALLGKRPYSTSSGNAFHIFSTCKRLVTSASLLVFWGGFGVPVSNCIFIQTIHFDFTN